MSRTPWRQLKPRADVIVGAIWADPTITTKAEVKSLTVGEIATLSGLTNEETRELLLNWSVNAKRYIYGRWQELNDNHEDGHRPYNSNKDYLRDILAQVKVHMNDVRGVSAETTAELTQVILDEFKESLDG